MPFVIAVSFIVSGDIRGGQERDHQMKSEHQSKLWLWRRAVANACLVLVAMVGGALAAGASPASAASPTAPTIRGGSTATVELVQSWLPYSDYYSGAIEISSSGTPTPTLTMTSGTLPPGFTFTPNMPFGVASINGASPPSAVGTYAVTVTATNGVAPDAVQHVKFVFASTKTTTTLSLSANTGTPSGAIPVVWMGQPVTLTAKVSPVPNGGTVSLDSGDAQTTPPCGPLPVNTATGVATCTTTFPAGGWGTDATYSGYGVFAPSDSNGVPLNVLRPGFWLATADGHVYGYEAACYKGQRGHHTVGPCPDGVVATSAATGPVVGITGTPDGKGYWVATANGGVSAFGDAKSYGDLPALGKHVSDVVAITATPDGKGYYLVGADGGFFTFGDAKFRGSLPGVGVHTKHVVGMVASPTGTGYLLVGWDGGVFTFGGCPFLRLVAGPGHPREEHTGRHLVVHGDGLRARRGRRGRLHLRHRGQVLRLPAGDPRLRGRHCRDRPNPRRQGVLDGQRPR